MNIDNENLNIVRSAVDEYARSYAEYVSTRELAAKQVGEKAKKVTVSTYKCGRLLSTRPDEFLILLKENDLFPEDGYGKEDHFKFVAKLLAAKSGYVFNEGELSRIWLTAKFAHINNIPSEDVEDWIERNGGVRGTYDLWVDYNRKSSANDRAKADAIVDGTLRLEVHAEEGFLGILDLSLPAARSLIRKHGYKPIPVTQALEATDPDDNPPPTGGGVVVGANDSVPVNVVACSFQPNITLPTILPVGSNDNEEPSQAPAWDGFTFASSFACAGGADYGLIAAGGQPVYANEFRKPVARLYELNHHLTVDTRSIVETVAEDYGCPTVMVGGFPCQPFSKAGKQLGGSDVRGQLGPVYAQKIVDVEPAVFICENVPPFLESPEFSAVFDEMKRIWGSRYRIRAFIVNAGEFGVPQTRHRCFIVGYHADLGFSFNFNDLRQFEERITLRQAIGDLKDHTVFVPHYQKGQRLTGDEYFGGNFSTFYHNSRIRRWDEQSYTIISHSLSIPLHPEPVQSSMAAQAGIWFNNRTNSYHRRFTIRECARIQTFPDSFTFGDANLALAHDVVGNAIPPELMKRIGVVVRTDLAKAGIIKPANDAADPMGKEVSHG